MVGEDFTNDLKLNTLLCDPENDCAVLYPDENSQILNEEAPAEKNITHLILIDGTWRKAKKIFMLSKNLHTLPTLRLDPKENSDYRIRKSPTDSALSTLEASIEALKVLEPTLDTSSATRSFKKMIDQQIEKMGRVLYQANYLNKKKER
jgi:DTW domain-containing protein YfiP